MPSLVRESFPRVPMEACLNGIPVLATNRGGLKEVLEQAGFLLDLPEHYQPDSLVAPTAEELAPWLEKITRLWDDAAFYESERHRCLAAAEAWRPEILLPRYEEVFAPLLARSSAREGPK